MADDGKITLTVGTEVDDTDVKALEDLLDELDNRVVKEKLELETSEATENIEEVEEDVEEVDNALSNAKESVEEFKEATDEAKGGMNALKEETKEVEEDVEVVDNALSNAKESVEEFKEATDEARDGMDGLKEEIEETSEATENASTSAKVLSDAIVGIGTAIGLKKITDAADNIENSWKRLKFQFRDTGYSIDDLRDKQAELSSSTGRSGGVIRDYFSKMANAGVTDLEAIGNSFEVLAGKSYLLNKPIEFVEGSMQRMALSGMVSGRSLISLGLLLSDVAKAMGVTESEASKTFKSLDQEKRLKVLTKAMEDSKAANEYYKESYSGLKDQAEASIIGLVGTIGQAMLPTIKPSIEAVVKVVKNLTDMFKGLATPVQQFIGILGSGLVGIIAIITVLGTFGKVAGSLKTGLDNIRLGLAAIRKMDILTRLSSLKSILQGVGEMASETSSKLLLLGRNALISGLNALRAAGMWVVQKTQLIATAIAEGIATASQWDLNLSMLMNPITIVVLAVIALIGALWYLYNTNETVRNAINEFGATLHRVWDMIVSTVMNAINTVTSFISAFTSQLGVEKDSWVNILLGFVFFVATLPLQIGRVFVDLIAKAVGFGDNFTSKLITAGANAVKGFTDKITALPNIIEQEFSQISRIVSDFVTTLPNRVWDLGSSIVDSLKGALGINSPGYMYYLLSDELERMSDLTNRSDLPKNIGGLGNNMLGAFKPTYPQNTGNNVSNVFNIHIGTVDKRERVDEIIEAVTDCLKHSNNVKGR